jgi:hypothetical protein
MNNRLYGCVKVEAWPRPFRDQPRRVWMQREMAAGGVDRVSSQQPAHLRTRHSKWHQFFHCLRQLRRLRCIIFVPVSLQPCNEEGPQSTAASPAIPPPEEPNSSWVTARTAANHIKRLSLPASFFFFVHFSRLSLSFISHPPPSRTCWYPGFFQPSFSYSFAFLS